MARTVRIRLEVETDQARRDVRGLSGDLGKLQGVSDGAGRAADGAGSRLRGMGADATHAGREVGGLTGVLERVGMSGGVGAVLGGIGAVEVVKRIVGGASDLNETISKSEQVFGNNADAIKAWSATSATALGLSQRAALDGASSFQNLFSQIGITGKEATGMSTNLVKLAGDFASFHNAAPEEVMDALLSATRGEYDALQRFVPTVNAAAIETEALADSGKTAAKELTNAEKATALYRLVVKDAGAATGDFARTSDSAANQQRILVANLEDSAAAVGQVVLPAYQSLLGVINTVGPGMIAAAAGVALLSNRLSAAGDGKLFGDLRAAHELYTEQVVAGTSRGTAAMGAMRTATVGLGTAAAGAGRAVMGIFGGPVGLALTGLTVGIGLLINQQEKSKQKTEETRKAWTALGEAYNTTHNFADKSVRDAIKNDKALSDLVKNADRYTTSIRDVTLAASGDPAAAKRAVDALNAQSAGYQKQIDYLTQLRDAQRSDQAARKEYLEIGGGKGVADRIQHLVKERDAVNALTGPLKERIKQAQQEADVQQAVADAQNNATTASQRLSGAAQALGPNFAAMVNLVGVLGDKSQVGKAVADSYSEALKGLAGNVIPATDALTQYKLISDSVDASNMNAAEKASTFAAVLGGLQHTAGDTAAVGDQVASTFGNIAGAALSARDKADLLKQSLDMLYGAQRNQTDAGEAQVSTSVALNASLEKNGQNFDLTTAKTDASKTATLANRDALQAALQATEAKYLADIAAGVGADQAKAAHDRQTTAILNQIDPTHRQSGAVQELAREYGTIPPAKHTSITADGFEAAFSKLLQAKVMQTALDQNLSLDAARAFANMQVAAHFPSVPQIADGGLVPGRSPHKKADNIHAMLTAREFVQPVDTVDYYGVGAMEAIRQRVIPRELLDMATIRQLNRTVRRPKAQQPGDGSQGVAFADGGLVWPYRVRTSVKMPVDVDDLKRRYNEQHDVLAWLKAQDGKPYIWASAGPEGYDCSGIVSAVWNKLHGRNPYSHTFSTMNEAPYFPKSGRGGPLTAGWANPGEQGGGSVGHTAGELFGVPFESGGGWGGVHVGPGATPIGSFAHMGHYANGGMVRAQLYDQGGWLPPGVTLAVNGTGRPERVLADANRSGDYGGGGAVVNQYLSVTVAPTVATTPAEQGAAVVKAIKQYEQSNGATWRK